MFLVEFPARFDFQRFFQHIAGDDFWDLIRRLGDCYVNDLQNRGGAAGVGQFSSDSSAFRRHSRDGIEGGSRVQNWTKPMPNLPKPPESSKTMPKPLRGAARRCWNYVQFDIVFALCLVTLMALRTVQAMMIFH
eukprot:s87_g17.t1